MLYRSVSQIACLRCHRNVFIQCSVLYTFAVDWALNNNYISIYPYYTCVTLWCYDAIMTLCSAMLSYVIACFHVECWIPFLHSWFHGRIPQATIWVATSKLHSYIYIQICNYRSRVCICVAIHLWNIVLTTHVEWAEKRSHKGKRFAVENTKERSASDEKSSFNGSILCRW